MREKLRLQKKPTKLEKLCDKVQINFELREKFAWDSWED